MKLKLISIVALTAISMSSYAASHSVVSEAFTLNQESLLHEGLYFGTSFTIGQLSMATLNNGNLSVKPLTKDSEKDPIYSTFFSTSSYDLIPQSVTSALTQYKSITFFNGATDSSAALLNTWLSYVELQRKNLESSNAFLIDFGKKIQGYDSEKGEFYGDIYSSNGICALASFSIPGAQNVKYCLSLPNITLNKSPFNHLKMPVEQASNLLKLNPVYKDIRVYGVCDLKDLKLSEIRIPSSGKFGDYSTVSIGSCVINKIYFAKLDENLHEVSFIGAFEAGKDSPTRVQEAKTLVKKVAKNMVEVKDRLISPSNTKDKVTQKTKVIDLSN